MNSMKQQISKSSKFRNNEFRKEISSLSMVTDGHLLLVFCFITSSFASRVFSVLPTHPTTQYPKVLDLLWSSLAKSFLQLHSSQTFESELTRMAS